MAEIITAVQSLREGKKICKPYWKSGSYWVIGEHGLICWSDGSPAEVHLNQLSSIDWKVYEDKEKFDINEIIQSVNTDTLIRELNRRASKW